MDAQNQIVDSGLDKLEGILSKEEQVACPVIHRFGEGVYIREAQMPAGSMVIGHRHKVACVNQMLFGKIIVVSDGEEKLLEGFNVFSGSAGERKAAIVAEDTVWQNIWANPDNEHDIDKLESRLLDKSDITQANEVEESAMISAFSDFDRRDFESVLDEYGLDPVTVRRQSENESDQIEMPVEWTLFTAVRKSDIEGRGLFLSWPLNKGDVVAPARIDGKRTPAGRYVNHSATPNCVYSKNENQDIYLMAARDISGCKGGGKGEELTVNYRHALELNGIEPKEEQCQG